MRLKGKNMNIPRFNDNNFPVKLGSVLKTPWFSWEKWGVQYHGENEYRILLAKSRKAYEDEWTIERNPDDIEIISQASQMADIADAPKLLNDSLGVLAAEKIQDSLRYKERLKILDIGCGEGVTTFTFQIPQNLLNGNRTKLTAFFPSLCKTVGDFLHEKPPSGGGEFF